MTTHPPGKQVLKRALKKWADELVDKSGRNQLLFYRKSGKVDLSNADWKSLSSLVAGGKITLKQLFPGASPEEIAMAEKDTENIRKRIRAARDELGVNIGKVALGLVTFTEKKSGKTALAPLFLADLEISKTKPGAPAHIGLAGPISLNETLIYVLQRDYGTLFDGDALDSLDGKVDKGPLLHYLKTLAEKGLPGSHLEWDESGPAKAFEASGKLFGEKSGAHKAVFTSYPYFGIGTFAYQKLSMVSDIEKNSDIFAQSALVAALAGDDSAGEEVLAQGVSTRLQEGSSDYVRPEEEFLILDADPSQTFAIDAAMSGRNMVIEGPPGTGKSQTIANLIATAIANGKKVLFVAEKQAAISAVMKRLESVGLSDIVVNLGEGGKHKRNAAEQIKKAFTTLDDVTRASNKPTVPSGFAETRDRMVEYNKTLHEPVAPWGHSLYELYNARLWLLSKLPEADLEVLENIHCDTKIPGYHGEKKAQVANAIRQLSLLGKFSSKVNPWAVIKRDIPIEDARAYFAKAVELKERLARYVLDCQEIASSHSLRKQPHSLLYWTQLFALVQSIEASLKDWSAETWARQDLGTLLKACAPKSVRSAQGWQIPFSERRAAWKEVKLALRGSGKKKEIYASLARLYKLRQGWMKLSSSPKVPRWADFKSLAANHEVLVSDCSRFYAFLYQDAPGKSPEITSIGIDDLLNDISRFTEDGDDARNMSRSNTIINLLNKELSVSITQIIDHLASSDLQRGSEENASRAQYVFEYVWTTGVIREITSSVKDAAPVGGVSILESDLPGIAERFRSQDIKQVASTPTRILSIQASRFQEAKALADPRSPAHRSYKAVLSQLGKKNRLLPTREILTEHRDIVLAAAPCWAMSPLIVSQTIPANAEFDIVIFDEASQIKPAESISVLARGKQAVVCGDSRQLPPSTFFEESLDDDTEDVLDSRDTDEVEALTDGSESLLDTFGKMFSSAEGNHVYRLLWHYRSKDPRLIDFSNKRFYNDKLIAMPSTSMVKPIRLEKVPGYARGLSQEDQLAKEVEHTVDLIVDHFAAHPDESLGVIAFSLKHAQRIETALELRRKTMASDTLDVLMSEDRDEPFFIKNLERVQGDERDAIIMSLGFYLGENGRVVKRFGPLNQEGGERRLNVAVSRAKIRVTLVSLFSHTDLDLDPEAKAGPKKLREYLEYAAEGGGEMIMKSDSVQMNAFEADIYARLKERGISMIIPQYGVRNYRLDFAICDPNGESLMMAVEADGASYHSSKSARARDRLRQQHLEALGWRFVRIWSTDYFKNPDREIERVVDFYKETLNNRVPLTGTDKRIRITDFEGLNGATIAPSTF